MFELKNKVALITGGTGGIGRSLIESFLSAGATVFTTSTTEKNLTSLLNEMRSEFDENLIDGCVLDLLNFIEVAKISLKVKEKFGSLDILICNAGITQDSLAIRMKNEDFQKVLDVNLTSNFILNREAIKIMMRQKFGRIINISSIVALSGNIGQANYVASKAGLIAMSKSLALETASRGITVNCIAPGFIETSMTSEIPQEIQVQYKAKIPLGEFGQARDIANAAIFLASNEARYITGETLNVNGGMLMN